MTSGTNWVNYVYVVQADYFRSRVKNLWLVPGSWQYGEWWEHLDQAEAAHEFGHMLGLPDEYTDTPDGNSVPVPGFENDIMGNTQGHVTDWDLNKVLAGRACG